MFYRRRILYQRLSHLADNVISNLMNKLKYTIVPNEGSYKQDCSTRSYAINTKAPATVRRIDNEVHTTVSVDSYGTIMTKSVGGRRCFLTVITLDHRFARTVILFTRN